MKKRLICTLMMIVVGTGSIFYGNSIKVSASTAESEISAQESMENLGDKQSYLDKLDAIESGLSDLDSYYAGNTMQMKYAAGEEYKRWNNALNEIYNDLQNSLKSEDVKSLQEDEKEWESFRDEEARKAADNYKGGSAEGLAYVASLAESTKDRCYELVYRYM